MTRRFARIAAAVATVAAALVSASAFADLGDSIVVAADGDVVVTFAGASTAYTSTLSVNGGPQFFNNFTTPVGTMFNLGSFTAGTVLDIAIFVTNTQLTYHSGLGTSNPDGIAHADVVYNYLGTPGLTFVGFEDLYGGGDRDYNDLTFTFSNAGAVTPVPEPETYALMLAGLGALGWAARRRRAGSR